VFRIRSFFSDDLENFLVSVRDIEVLHGFPVVSFSPPPLKIILWVWSCCPINSRLWLFSTEKRTPFILTFHVKFELYFRNQMYSYAVYTLSISNCPIIFHISTHSLVEALGTEPSSGSISRCESDQAFCCEWFIVALPRFTLFTFLL